MFSEKRKANEHDRERKEMNGDESCMEHLQRSINWQTAHIKSTSNSNLIVIMCGIETELKRREEWNTLATGLRRMKLKHIRRLPP